MEQKATSTLMDTDSTGLKAQSAATGTRAGVHVCWSPPSGYTPGSAVCLVIPQCLICFISPPGFPFLAEIQGSSLLYTRSGCLHSETFKIVNCSVIPA